VSQSLFQAGKHQALQQTGATLLLQRVKLLAEGAALRLPADSRGARPPRRLLLQLSAEVALGHELRQALLLPRADIRRRVWIVGKHE